MLYVYTIMYMKMFEAGLLSLNVYIKANRGEKHKNCAKLVFQVKTGFL